MTTIAPTLNEEISKSIERFKPAVLSQGIDISYGG
jgi:hypothetical protein